MLNINKGALFVVMGTILFSSKAIMVKYLYQITIDPLDLQTLRMLFVLPFYVGLLAFLTLRKGCIAISAKELLGCAVAGIACYHIASYLDLLGLQYITAGLERIILFCYPAIAILFSWLLLGEKPMPKLWLALALSYAGILLFFYADMTFGGENLVWGSFLVFVASIFTAWFMVANQKYSRRFGSQRFICLAMIAASISLLMHSMIAGTNSLMDYTAQHYWGVLVVSIFMTLIPSFLIGAGVKLIGASKAGIVGTVGPLFTILLSNQLLGEPISTLHIVGLCLVLFGMRQLKS